MVHFRPLKSQPNEFKVFTTTLIIRKSPPKSYFCELVNLYEKIHYKDVEQEVLLELQFERDKNEDLKVYLEVN